MRHTKGIILAGGRGTRLYPLTAIASKQLQPIYDKPMIYYPLTTLMLAGVKEIMLISTPEDLPRFRGLLGDASQWGITIEYAEQQSPRGIAEALIIARDFVADHASLLVLGDNLIFGDFAFLRAALTENGTGATIFGYRVLDPRGYAVVEFNAAFEVLSLEEKPERPRSSWAVPGLYIYGPGAAERAARLHPSARGELEITDLNCVYLAEGALRARPIGRGIAWFDTGTPESLLEASNFVHAIQARQGLVIGSPEEAAYRMGYLSSAEYQAALARIPPSRYREFLQRVADEKAART